MKKVTITTVITDSDICLKKHQSYTIFFAVVLGIFAIMLNYFFYKNLFLHAFSFENFDIEYFSILCGIIITIIIGIVCFIWKWKHGFLEALSFLYPKLFIINFFSMLLCSIFIPFIVSLILDLTYFSSFWNFIYIFVSSIIILGICSFFSTLLCFFIIIVLGSILSFIFYSISSFVYFHFINRKKLRILNDKLKDEFK